MITDEMVKAAAKFICCSNARCAFENPGPPHEPPRSCMSKEYEYDARATLSAAVPMIEFDLASQNAALFAALMPFAKECERWGHLSLGPDIDHWNIGGNSLTLGDLRRARDAIAKATGA